MRLHTLAVDRRTRERCEIVHAERVPEQRDLLGKRIPAHQRYVVVFPDSRWANDRTDADLISED